jgi:hypothetical protein
LSTAREFLLTLLVALSVTASVVSKADATDEPAPSGSLPGFRRLNEVQYKRSIEDIFGENIKIPGRFEPPLRFEGLLAIGDSQAAVTPSGFEQYELRARDIAAQALARDHRQAVMPCAPASASTFDEPCARQFLTKYGRLLFRRPLVDDEIASIVTLTRAETQQSGDFYTGLQFGLARLLMSPNFLFRVETPESGRSDGAAGHLDDYSLATRLSFLMWDAPPDTTLLDAAANGELHDRMGLQKQVDRLIASPRFEQGVRAFFSDMFGYDQFEGLSKDQSIYPKYTSQLSKDAQEQTLRVVVDLLVTQKGDYRDLFTTKRTFLNRNLGALYHVQVGDQSFGGWQPYTFSSADPHTGILTLAAFLMLDSTHEGRSSPTIRGKSVRELLLCQKVPPPPGNVDFKLVQDIHNPLYKTARERLTAHRDNPSCAGCHSITDPIGLSMENYDAIGEHRAQENGATIDAGGTFESKPYADIVGLERILHDSPAVPNCLVERAYEYGVGRKVVPEEHDLLGYFEQRFAKDGYALPSLMQTIATSQAFQVVASETVASN